MNDITERDIYRLILLFRFHLNCIDGKSTYLVSGILKKIVGGRLIRR